MTNETSPPSLGRQLVERRGRSCSWTGAGAKVAWSFRPGDVSTQSREDMISVFGYAVGRWEDRHQLGSDVVGLG